MNDRDTDAVWEAAQKKVCGYGGVDLCRAELFLSKVSLRPAEDEEDAFVLVCGDGFIAKWVEAHYAPLVERALGELGVADASLRVERSAG